MTALIIVVGIVGVVATINIFWQLGAQSVAIETHDAPAMEESTDSANAWGAVLLVAGVGLALLAAMAGGAL